MNLPQVHDAPLRRAALVLHAMSDADRDWMLASLPAAHSRLLQPLLAELNLLGLSRDPELVRQIAAALTSADAAASPAASVKAKEVQRLATHCAGEPPELLAHLLAMQPALRAEVLACLAAPQREAIALLEDSLPAAPALREFLRVATRQDLATPASARHTSWWKRSLWGRREA